MRPTTFLLLLCALPTALPATAARAQDAPQVLAALTAAPQGEAASGSAESAVDGASATTRFRFQSPGVLRLDVAANSQMGTPARAAFASEGATVEVEGERARRIRFNVLEEWFRPDSSAVAQVLGPCLLPLRGLAQNYTLQQSREGEATIIEARANERGKYLRRDQVRAGGAGGERFYAARTRPFWNRPARMRLRVEGGRITRREDFPPDAAPGDKPQQTWTWLYEGGRPTLAQVHDWRGVRSGSWNLKFDGAPAAAEPVDVPASAVVEGDAAPGDETAQAFARGVALARADLFSLAAGEMARAAGLKPRAVAIARAQFEVALATRDAVRARGALEKIAALEGEGSPAHALRRARLALFSRDEAALATALQSLPQVLAAGTTVDDRLAGADLARAGGQMEAAATILLPLLEGGLPAPLEALAVARLDDLFSPLQPAQRAALAQRITSASTSAQVARALVEGKGAPEIDAAQFSALASLLARRAALEGRDEEAARLWSAVAQSGSESGYFSAQLALAQLGARQKDAASTLAAHRAAWPRLDGERAREEWLSAVAGSWLKAANTEVLRTALRSTTARAGAQPSDVEADARLALALSESSDDDATILAFVRTQATRSRAAGGARAAWWQGRLAEELAGAARAATNKPGDRGRTRDRLYDEALRAVEAARVLDPEQEYYAAQKALLSARRVALPEAVVDAGSAVRDRKAAADAAAELVQKFPRSVDARLSAGLAQLTAGQSARAVALLRVALQVLDAPPASTGAANAESQEDDNSPGARVARVTARASLAGALRKAGDRAGAQGLYAALFEGARSSTEQAAFALNWLNVLFEARETAGAAAVISQVARTPWAPSQAQAALAQVLGSVSVRPQWRAAVRESLEAASASGANSRAGADASLRALSEGAILAAAYLDFSSLNSARRRALANAPAEATGGDSPEVQAAAAVWRRGLPRLERLAAGGGATVAAQALSILAQDALLRGRADEAATFYERALERAPEDAGLAASLSDALLAKAAPAPVGTAAGTATALATRALDEDAPRILRARDALLARGPRDSGALAQAALMSRAAGREEDARTLLQRAQALAFFDASVGAGTYDSLVELLKGDAQVLAPTP